MCRSNIDTLSLAKDKAEQFTGLPGRVGRFQLINALEEVGDQLGFKGSHIRYLRLLVSYTRESDWRDEDTYPSVWLALQEIANRLSLTSRRVNQIEKDLVALQAIAFNDYGNYRRRGGRNEDGSIRYAYGVDLRPLALLWEELALKVEMNKQNRQLWKETRYVISGLRRQIGDIARSGHAVIVDVVDEVLSEKAMTSRIRPRASLDDLKEIVATLQEWLEKLIKALAGSFTKEAEKEEPLQGENAHECQENFLPVCKKFHPPYKYNKDNNIDESEEERLRSLREQPFFDPQPQQPQPPTRERDNNAMSLGSILDKSPFADRKKTAKEKKTGSRRASLSLEKVVASSPKVFREAMYRPDAPIIEDIVLACQEVAPLLGLSFEQRDNLWKASREQLGIRDACMLWIVTLSRHLEGEIESPCGFILRMLEKDKQGQLNLNASLLGMIKRATVGQMTEEA